MFRLQQPPVLFIIHHSLIRHINSFRSLLTLPLKGEMEGVNQLQMKQLIYCLALLSPLFSTCQSISITGTIVNDEGNPIPAATITIKGTDNATVANSSGAFTLFGTSPNDSLIVSATGYQTTTEPNNMRGLITVILKRKPPFLKVGDTMPDIELSNFINFPVSKIQLSAVNKQLVLLDFWATTCASCLKSFPTLDSLQTMFTNKIQIFLVNPKRSGDDTARINRMLQKAVARFGKPINLPIVVGDTVAFELFGFTAVPRYVWIDRHRVIRAITNSKSLTAETIQTLLEGKLLQTPATVAAGKKEQKH